MLFGKYMFNCYFETDAILPWYKGSTFRGVFGHALKKVVCAPKNQECEGCLLKTQCLYTRVFEPSLTGKKNEGLKFNAKPPPFVIEPPLTNETRFPKGSTFDFSLVLLGEINQNFPYFLYTFDQMGKIGIGRRIKGRRGHFALKTVTGGDNLIYSEENQELREPDACEILTLDEPDNSSPVCSRLSLVLETPLRLKFKNRLAAELPFHVLVRAMLRRASTLMTCYGKGNPPLDFRGLVQRAESVRTIENRLSWFDWRRYSNRQEQKMLMGGLIGSVIYEGDIGEFMLLIKICEKIHVGKQTTFGLGKIMTDWIE